MLPHQGEWFVPAVLFAAVFLWAVFYFFGRYLRTRFLVLYKSSGTDQLAHELSRIATALEHIAQRRDAAEQISVAVNLPGNGATVTPPQAATIAKRRGIVNSMFGR